MSIEHKWRPAFRYIPRFSILNVNIRADGRTPIILENRAFRNRSAWVLTGGRSSRMGRDKALIDINGRPLALRVAEEAGRFCDSVSLVGDPALYGMLGLRVVPDTFPGQGPLAGIEAALGASGVDWNLIVACDMPALGSAAIERLFELNADCALPQYEDGRVEPLCAVYHRRCHAPVRAALESGVRKVTDALRRLEADGFAVRYLPVSSAEPFANLNTPREVQEYLNG
jgi:molybdopterin-guanine dinucleotide biosynthesis protein A